MHNRTRTFFGSDAQFRNRSIVFSDPTSEKPFLVLATDRCPDMHLVGAASGSVILGRMRVIDGRMIDNVTDWALEGFRDHYETLVNKLKPSITKDAIFHYVYAVLHDPIYREKYALNLKRDFPRIPFYPDFRRWSDWGETLMNLHIGYETVEPWPLRRLDTPDERSRNAGLSPKVMLKPNKDNGIIQLDTETQLIGMPREAWDYRLGNRSALEWILDQHKEKTPRDATIREKFNTYRFADHKEKVIDLLMRLLASASRPSPSSRRCASSPVHEVRESHGGTLVPRRVADRQGHAISLPRRSSGCARAWRAIL
jgi:predicted helicase